MRGYIFSILSEASFRILGSSAFSSGVKRERTKSMSPSFFLSSSFPVPMRRRGNSSVFNSLIIDFRPLLPPAEPFSLWRILPKSRLKSSQIISRSSREIL